eukprot:Skav204111  [mRNA]  locus=scaffold5190:38655:42626:+ [translate_table: standard]
MPPPFSSPGGWFSLSSGLAVSLKACGTLGEICEFSSCDRAIPSLGRWCRDTGEMVEAELVKEAGGCDCCTSMDRPVEVMLPLPALPLAALALLPFNVTVPLPKVLGTEKVSG